MAQDFDQLYKRIMDAGISSPTHRDELIYLNTLTRGAISNADRDRPAALLDLGTMTGVSAMVMARLVREMGRRAVIVSVDNYSQSGSLQATKAIIEKFGFADVVKLVQADDLEYVLSRPNASLSLAFVDSLHTGRHVTKLLEALVPKLTPLAVLCGHDYSPLEYGVVCAVEAFKRRYSSQFVGWSIYKRVWWTMKREESRR